MPSYSSKFMSPAGRVGYTNHFKPQKSDGGDAKRDLTLVFPAGADLSSLENAVKEAIEEEWGSKPPKGLILPMKKHTSVRKDGTRHCDHMPDLYEDDDDAVFIRAISYQKVDLVDEDAEDILDKEEFYPGCIARATMVAKTYENSNGKGVTLYMNNVQKLADGDRIGKGEKTSGRDDFAKADAEDVSALFG